MARANVPQFGNWDSDQNVPYTVYFEKARKNRGGKMINPNDPQESPELYSNMEPWPLHGAPPKPAKRGGIRPTPERRQSKEEDSNDFNKPFVNSPDLDKNSSRKSANESSYGGRSQKPSRSSRTSMGSEQSFDRSPLHPQFQAKNSYDSSHGTPGRARLRPTAARGDESPVNKGAAVPRFGGWDDKDPQSAENYTHIFDKVRAERNSGGGNVYGGTPKHPSYDTHVQTPKKSKGCCCFPWF